MTSTISIRPRSPEPEAKPIKVPPNRGAAGPSVPQTFPAEQYRVLAHMVEQLATAGRTVIAISSAVGGDGKTTTALNLARTLSRGGGAQVLLIDADLRRGSIGERLGIVRSSGRGLAGALSDPACSIDAVVKRLPTASLCVLPAGVCPPRPYEALRSLRVGELLHEARVSYDYVLVDTPPIVPVADVRALTQWVDGIILVVTAHYTPRELLDEALSALPPEKVIGIVFNGDDQPLSGPYRHYYNYYAEPRPKPGFWASLLGSGAGR